MTTRNRLTARAQMHGEVREPGYIFTLEDGVLGPHKTVPRASIDSQIVDHLGQTGDLIDLPLYEQIADEQDGDILKVYGDAGYPQDAAVVDAQRAEDEKLVELGALQAPDADVHGSANIAPSYMEPKIVDALPNGFAALGDAGDPKADEPKPL